MKTAFVYTFIALLIGCAVVDALVMFQTGSQHYQDVVDNGIR